MKQLDDFFASRKKVMLQFSAGKDSAACLWLLEPWWDRLDVVWCNMGNPYPETLDYMGKIAVTVPNFHMVVGNQPESIRLRGYPVDMVPVGSTELGRMISRDASGPLMRPFWECCRENAWDPLDKFRRDNLYDGVIRGQRLEDPLQSPIPSGAVIDGSEYFFPISNWTTEAVFDFLGDRTPASYSSGCRSSLDCKNCTAYAFESQGTLAHLQTVDAKAAEEVRWVRKALRDKLTAYTSLLED